MIIMYDIAKGSQSHSDVKHCLTHQTNSNPNPKAGFIQLNDALYVLATI